MFSSQQLITPQRSTELGRNLVAKLSMKTIAMVPSSRGRNVNPARNRNHGIEHGGHSDRETPEPFPNSEDKPVHVLYCTQMRELSGNTDRCRAHLTLFWSGNFSYQIYNETHNYWIYYYHLALLHCRWGSHTPEKAASCRELPCTPNIFSITLTGAWAP